MTPAQIRRLHQLHEDGYIECGGYGRSQHHRACEALIRLGLAECDWGPRRSFLSVQSFLPLWQDPIV